jgi:hypothetical protein
MRRAAGLLHVSQYIADALGDLMAIIDMTTIDTTPGAGGAMAPPAGTDLTKPQYLDLMRKRYRDGPLYRQHMGVFARRLYDLDIIGPFAEEARNILGKLGA